MSAYDTIDLSALPLPPVVAALDAEAVVAELKAWLVDYDPDLEAVLTLESEPLVELLEALAYRETLWRASLNDAALAVLVPTATGGDLDHLAALVGLTRATLVPAQGDPLEPAVLESDAALRRRVMLAPTLGATAGSRASYVAQALAASTAVRDAAAVADAEDLGAVTVTILSTAEDGTPSVELLAQVTDHLNDETVRPLTDTVTVQAATVTTYTIEATLYTYAGPASQTVLTAAEAAALAYAEARFRLGHDVTLSGLYQALHVAGVQRVELAAPAATLEAGETLAYRCTEVTLTWGGVAL